MKPFSLIAILPIFILLACSSAPVKQEVIDGPSARVRFFGNNGLHAHFDRDGKCTGERVLVSGGMGSSFKAFIGSEQNESIGMPMSDRVKEKRGRILANEFYKEYVVAAGKPIAFVFQATAPGVVAPRGYIVTGRPASCGAGGRFIPEEGKDYDVFFNGGPNSCSASVNEIAPDGSGIPVAFKPRGFCD